MLRRLSCTLHRGSHWPEALSVIRELVSAYNDVREAIIDIDARLTALEERECGCKRASRGPHEESVSGG